MIKVSIIVPVYNKEQYIIKTIESVLSQTYKNFELILINDGSTDKSGEVIQKYQRQDSRISYIENTNKGVSYTRNLGIEISKGKYISFLDADDELDSKFLEKMILAIGNLNVCYCGHYNVIDGVKIKPRMKFNKGDIFENYIYNKCTPNTNSWLINKEFLDKYNIRFDTNISYGEDMLFFSKILLHEKNIACVKEHLTYYYLDVKSSLSQNNIDNIYKDIYWMQKLKEYISENEQDLKRKDKLIKAINSYRLPASIIYRINSNLMFVDKGTLKYIMNNLKEYLKKLKLSNGLRSMKLFYVYFRLKLKLKNI